VKKTFEKVGAVGSEPRQAEIHLLRCASDAAAGQGVPKAVSTLPKLNRGSTS
jgi:hypothetical protein